MNEFEVFETFGEVADLINKLCGLDLTEAEVVAEYADYQGVQRWIVQTPDKEWGLIYNISKAAPQDMLAGGGSNVLIFSSSPMMLLHADAEFSLIEHGNVYDALRDAIKTRGVKEGTPYITLSSVSPIQSMSVKTIIRKLGWNGVNIGIEPLGTTASGMTFYADGDGDWTV